MKVSTVFASSLLVLSLAVTMPASAQHDRDDHEHGRGEHGNGRQEHGNPHRASQPERHEERAERRDVRHDGRAERREDRHDDQRWSRDERREQGRAHYQPVDRPERRDFDHGRPRDIWQRNRAEHWEHEHHNWRERGGYRGYRIPEERFRAHFGRGHWFRVHSVPVIVVERYPRFQYAGFWFTLVDPWPETWSARWYETDDVYVDYINDGYYMCNRSHPGVFIAVNVSM